MHDAVQQSQGKLDARGARAENLPMSAAMPPPLPSSLIISEPYAGLQAQALGLAGAAGLAPDLQVLTPRAPWDLFSARLWPAPLARVAAGRLQSRPEVLISAGGVGAAVAAAQRPRPLLVHIQHPRMNPQKFDVVVVARHDALTGANVLVTRTALHQVTPARLAAAAEIWRPRLKTLPRPLVACLIGGSNGRFRLDEAVAGGLAEQFSAMMRSDKVGLAITPSRRTDPAAMAQFEKTLGKLGAWIWDGAGDNPYFGLLALADAIIVTVDSVSMVSEAVATSAPVMLAQLPGRSSRIGRFLAEMEAAGRVRPFAGRCERWPVEPLDDTAEIAAELRRRLGY
jgi:mitochondrial fission protein ELM1